MVGSRDLTYVPHNEAAAVQLAEFGTFLAYFDGLPGEREAEGVRQWAAGVAASGSVNAVYMDTTTIATAKRLLDGEAPSYPSALFDLANFVNAVILSDTIFHLERTHLDSISINEFLGLANDPPLISVPTISADPAVGSVLRGAWLQSTEYAQRVGSGIARLAADAEQIKASWESLAGEQIDWADWGERAREFTSRAYGDISVPSDIFETAANLFREDVGQLYRSTPTGRQRLSDFILEANNRSLFNLTVASVLKVQYAPNAFRLPFQQHLFRKGYAACQRFVRLVDDAHQRELAKVFATGTRMRLPFFLSAILEKSASLEEFREILAESRSRAAPFRRRRAEFNEAIANGNTKAIDGILRAITREEAPRLWQWCAAGAGVGSVAAVAAAIEAHQPGVMFTLEVAAEVTVAPAVGIAMHALPHALRPRPRFLTHMAEAAANLGDARARIGKLWSMPTPDDDYAEALNRVAALEY